MSWEENIERHSCFCGKGEYEVLHREDDWGQHESRYRMLCSVCKEKYTYCSGGPFDRNAMVVDRGWVLKSVLEDEKKYRENIEKRSKELYYDEWRKCFADAKSKKQIWSILTLNGKYYPSLGTFYNHNKAHSIEKILLKIDANFTYNNLKQVFDVCKVDPDWKYLGVNTFDKNRFHPDNS